MGSRQPLLKPEQVCTALMLQRQFRRQWFMWMLINLSLYIEQCIWHFSIDQNFTRIFLLMLLGIAGTVIMSWINLYLLNQWCTKKYRKDPTFTHFILKNYSIKNLSQVNNFNKNGTNKLINLNPHTMKHFMKLLMCERFSLKIITSFL